MVWRDPRENSTDSWAALPGCFTSPRGRIAHAHGAPTHAHNKAPAHLFAPFRASTPLLIPSLPSLPSTRPDVTAEPYRPHRPLSDSTRCQELTPTRRAAMPALAQRSVGRKALPLLRWRGTSSSSHLPPAMRGSTRPRLSLRCWDRVLPPLAAWRLRALFRGELPVRHEAAESGALVAVRQGLLRVVHCRGDQVRIRDALPPSGREGLRAPPEGPQLPACLARRRQNAAMGCGRAACRDV